MKTCKYCGAVVEDFSNFCINCGNVIETNSPQPNTYWQNPYTPINYTAYPPVPPQPVKPSGGSKAMGIVGMILSISGFTEALSLGSYSLLMLFSSISMFFQYNGISIPDEDEMFAIFFFSIIMIIIAAICSIPGIIGFILGRKSRNNGNYGRIPKFAQGFGIANTILCVFIIGILFISATIVSDISTPYY